MFDNTVIIDDELRKYLRTYGGIETKELKQIRELARKHPQQQMQSSAEQAQLLFFLTRLIHAKHALELGVFFGHATLAIALGLPQDGKIIACDTSYEFVSQASRYWKQAGVQQRIDLRVCNARDLITQLNIQRQADFDLTFIDADKASYNEYYEGTLTMLRSGGLLVIDNTLWKGQVTRPQKHGSHAKQMHAFNEIIANDDRVEHCLLPLSDGMTLVRKK